jgi:hypothetical protein
VSRRVSAALRALVLVAAAATLAACESGGASGQSCGTIRQELDALDRRGTQGKVEAASQGKKLSPKDKGDVDRYNSLLNQYLGARCHV